MQAWCALFFFSNLIAGLPLFSGGVNQDLAELPQLNVANASPAIRRQLEEAYSAARAAPRDAGAVGKLGMVLDTYEQFASAAVCYQRAHLLDPGSFGWTYYLGVVESREGHYGEAAEALRVALGMRPDYLPARLKLADSLLAEGKFEESGRAYEQILKDHPEAAAADYGLGRSEVALGNLAAAVKSYRAACDLFPSYGAAHYALALAYRKLGENALAEHHFNLYQADKTNLPLLADPLLAAVQELNHGPAAYLRRAVALEAAGKIEDAARELERAVEVDPSDVQLHINLISLYGRLGESERAEQQYRIAVSLNPNRADCHYNYGVLLLKEDKLAQAEQAFRRTLELNPNYAEAHNNLGYLLEQRGRVDEALAEYQQAVRDRPDYRLAHFHIGRILVDQKRYDEGIHHLQRTLTPVDSSTPGYLRALGSAYGRAGKREDALRYIRQARAEAAARGQTQLVASIDRELQTLEQEGQH